MIPNELQLYYSSSEVASDGGSLPQKTVTDDAANRYTIDWSDASGIDWSYAVGWFDNDTTTVALRGVLFSVWSATGSAITLATQLPTEPQTGDTFRLAQGLSFQSSMKIPINAVNASAPELATVELVFLSGVTIKQCRSDADLYVRYDADDETITISLDNETWNCSSALDVSSAVTDGYVQTTTGEWLSIDVDDTALPATSTTQRILVSEIHNAILPVVWVESESFDLVLHHFAVMENESSGTEDITAFANEIASTTLAAQYNDGDEYIDLTDGEGFPGRDFWLHLDESIDDIRYVTQRAGNRCYLADTSDWMIVPFNQGTTEPPTGQRVEDLTTQTAGMLRAVYVTSGSWALNDAAGFLWVSDYEGASPWNTGEFVEESPQPGDVYCETDGTPYFGIREKARQPIWYSGDTVQNYPDFDLALIAPESSSEYTSIEHPQDTIPTSFSPWFEGAVYWEKEIDDSSFSSEQIALVFRRILLEGIQGNLQIEQNLFFDWET